MLNYVASYNTNNDLRAEVTFALFPLFDAFNFTVFYQLRIKTVLNRQRFREKVGFNLIYRNYKSKLNAISILIFKE